MSRRAWGIIFLLIIAMTLGMRLGKVTRPENYQVNGSLTVLETGAPTGTSYVGDYKIEWNNEVGGQLTVKNKEDKVLWQTIAGEAFVAAAQQNDIFTENRGMFKIKDKVEVICLEQTVDLILDTPPTEQVPSGGTTISGHLYCNNNRSTTYNLYFQENENSQQLEMSLNTWMHGSDTLDPFYINRVYLTYASDPKEHPFGFGEQFTYADMKGRVVPIWVSEQGVGRGEQPITIGANLTNGGAGGNAFTSYAPIPFYLTNQMHGFSLSNNAYSEFDFRKADRVQVKVNSSVVLATILDGDTPAEIIENYTKDKRMKELPEWTYAGAIVGMQGGTEKVERVGSQLERRGVPISAFWLQDWVGQRTTSFGKQLWWNWEVDYDRYPKWDEMVADFESEGIKTMVYASPYLADIGDLKPNMRRNLFQEAAGQGYLIKDQSGNPYLILNTDFYFGMIDLTNPKAWDWYKQVLKEQVAGSGANGWMADFGEGLPYDAVLYEGDPQVIHNEYPILWAKLNREVVDELGGDYIFFNRAAYTQSPAYSTLFWEGDQLVSWSEYDGIKSAVTGLNTAGLSGLAFNHSDIGGYTTVTNPLMTYHRSRELLYRWMELNAFTLIFRTHEGNQPDNNVQFYTDDEMLDTFAYWAKVYAALFDYRKELVQQATETGLPVVRHPFIQYPDDPETWKITYQEFMLGSDFLIAPVTDEGETEVTVYLPQGEWTHLWSGQTYQGGQYATVPAPMAQPGVFYIKGSEWGEELAAKLSAEGLMP